MNTISMGVIALCVVVGASTYLSQRRAATDGPRPAQTTSVQSANVPMNKQAGLRAGHAAEVQARGSGKEPAFEADASDLEPPPQPLNHAVDALNADIGPEGRYVDPAALAEVLRSDAELGRLLNE